MKNWLGKYLRVIKENDTIQLVWNRLNYFSIFMLVLIPMLIFYGMAGMVGWEEVGDTKVLPIKGVGAVIYWSLVVLMALQVFFNRKSILKISGNEVHYRKRPFLSKSHSFHKNDISSVETKLFKDDWAETEPATMHVELFYIFIYLKNGEKIKLGSFNEDDCKIFKEALV